MIPASSYVYTFLDKTTTATGPRFPGSVVLAEPSFNQDDYQLEIAYRAYKRKEAPKSGPRVNLVFHHGVGMNKGIWHYHIDKWFNLIPNVNYSVAIDCVNHGQSAVLNESKLGHKVSWIDFAKDVIKVVKIDEAQEFLKPGAVNIFLGHSCGGMVSLTSAYFEPTLFDAIIALNPVAYADELSDQLLTMGINMWRNKGSITNEYDVEEGQDHKLAIYSFYKTKSFFRAFDDTILRNMLEDEHLDYDVSNKALTSTQASQEYLTFMGSGSSIRRAFPSFGQIETSVYHIVGEKDTAPDQAVQAIREALAGVVHPIDVPGGSHMFNAIKPEVFTDIVKKIITERIEVFEQTGDKRYPDEVYMKTHGSDYKQVLTRRALEDGSGKPNL